MAAPPAAAVREVVGLDLRQAIARLHPAGRAADHAAMAGHYKAAFRAACGRDAHHEPLYPGAGAALDALEAAGVLLGIATGKGRDGLLATLERHGLAGRFTTLQTADRGPSKPDPAALYRALEETGVDAKDAVMIGDTSFDMAMAESAGIAAVGVGWGYHPAAALYRAGALTVVESYQTLVPTLERLVWGQG